MTWTYARRIAWADVDLTGSWRFAAALLIVEEAETSLLRSAGLIGSVPDLPRVSVSISFSHPAAFDEEVWVDIRSVRFGRTSIRYAFAIRGADEFLAEGEVVAVHTGRNGRPRRIPTEIRHAIELAMGTTSDVTTKAQDEAGRR